MLIEILLFILVLILSACAPKQGPAGATGPQGNPGVGCSESVVKADPSGPAPYGGLLITCGKQANILLNGAPGQQGPQGEQGVAGTPGTLFTVQSWCANDKATYPEQYVRVGNQDYAVLDGVGIGAYLSEIPAGTWETSDSSCTFTVDSDGTVSNCNCN